MYLLISSIGLTREAWEIKQLPHVFVEIKQELGIPG